MSSRRKIFTADLETDPFDHGHFPRPFWAGLFDGKNHWDYWGADCVEKFIDRIWDLDGIIYFHNGGKFDFHFLLPYLPDEINIFMIGARLVSIKFRGVELRDSFAILPVALKQGGKKIEIDYEIFREEFREDNKTEITDYARGDNVALYDLVVDFIDRYGMNITLASAAFNQLKLLGIDPPQGREEKDEKLRQFYYGGRVQCFETGIFEGDLKYIDINSAYPYAMMAKHCFDQSFTVNKKVPEDEELFNASFFELTCHSRGAFPLRTKTGLSFPVGRGEFFVTGWEVRAGLDTGMISDVEYNRIHKPNTLKDFKPFVNKFYAMKKQADKDGDSNARLFAKLMLNSAYGKFALDPRKFKDYEIYPIGDLSKQEIIEEGLTHKCDFDEAGFSVFARELELSAIQRAFKNVGTAASITGYVRAYLFRALCEVDRPLYCDTDSIVCYGSNSLPMGKELGEWDLEAEGTKIAIAGKKMYALTLGDGTDKVASKGVRAKAGDIRRAAKGEVINIKNEAPTYSLITKAKFITRDIKKTVDDQSQNPFS